MRELYLTRAGFEGEHENDEEDGDAFVVSQTPTDFEFDDRFVRVGERTGKGRRLKAEG